MWNMGGERRRERTYASVAMFADVGSLCEARVDENAFVLGDR